MWNRIWLIKSKLFLFASKSKKKRKIKTSIALLANRGLCLPCWCNNILPSSSSHGTEFMILKELREKLTMWLKRLLCCLFCVRRVYKNWLVACWGYFPSLINVYLHSFLPSFCTASRNRFGLEKITADNCRWLRCRRRRVLWARWRGRPTRTPSTSPTGRWRSWPGPPPSWSSTPPPSSSTPTSWPGWTTSTLTSALKRWKMKFGNFNFNLKFGT